MEVHRSRTGAQRPGCVSNASVYRNKVLILFRATRSLRSPFCFPPSTSVDTSLSKEFHTNDERFFACPQSRSASINDFGSPPGMRFASKSFNPKQFCSKECPDEAQSFNC